MSSLSKRLGMGDGGLGGGLLSAKTRVGCQGLCGEAGDGVTVESGIGRGRHAVGGQGYRGRRADAIFAIKRSLRGCVSGGCAGVCRSAGRAPTKSSIDGGIVPH